MKDTKGHYHPLPVRQFRWYLVFFHALTLGSLLGAICYILWTFRGALGWPEFVGAILLLVQAGIYLGFMLFVKDWPLSRPRLLLYFGVNLTLWLVELWLVPDVFWIIFAFIGQMFGMLPTRYGVIATAFVSVVLFASNAFGDRSGLGAQGLLGMLALWATLFVFMLYINHLTRTSQERAELIAELQAAKKDLELAQQQEAELAVFQERERMARDLHDSLGHALVAFSVQLEAVQRLYRVDSEAASGQVDEMKAHVRSSMDALRRSIAGLRAPGLEDRSLRPALLALGTDFGQRTGLNVTCEVDEGANNLRPALAEALWRIAQEALTNVEKHADARRVSIGLECGPDEVTLSVIDDGVGLPQGAEHLPNRYGLRGMRERVLGLGGTLAVETENGTAVYACLPIISGGSREA